MATHVRTPEVPLDKIDVVEGFNSRTHMDRAELDQLAATVKVDGLVQPVSVRPTEDGRYALVAGHRRFEAAKRAGLKKVPITLSRGNPRAEAFVENHHRSDLDPIETALDLKAFAEEFGLTTYKAIAKRAGKKPEWVADHMHLLDLPKKVQRYIAAGEVPAAAEPRLRKVAEVSPALAATVCELAKREGVSGSAFLERFAEFFSRAGEAEVPGKPTLIRVPRFALSKAIADPDRHAELTERINGLDPYVKMKDPTVELGDAELDAARAAGCLAEHHVDRGGYRTTTAYITDQAFAADLIVRALDRIEKEKADRAETEAKRKTERKEQQQKLRQERKERGEETPQAEAKRRAAIARRFNEDLGINLLKGRRAARRKKHGLARAKAVAHLLIAGNREMAARGLRLTCPDLQDIEVKHLKSGGRREKVNYADTEQCESELLRRVDAARSEGEVNEVLAESIIAALIADQDELPQSKRVRWYSSVEDTLAKILASEIKEVRPRRSRKAA